MAFDPNKLSENQKTIYAHLVVQCGAERAQELIQSLERIEGSFRKAHAGAVSLEKGIGNINRIVGTFGSAMNSFTGFINASNVSLKAGLDLSMKYRDSFVQTFAQMQKHGMTVAQYTDRIEKLRKTYNLSYQDAMKLTSSLETSFNMTNPAKLDGYLQGLRRTVGSNIDAMSEFRQALEGVTKKNPELQAMLASGNFEGARKSAAAMLAGREIDYDTYKKFLEAAQAQNRPASEQQALNDLQSPANTIRSLQVGIETGVKKAGDTTLEAVDAAHKWASGLGDVNNVLSEIVNKFTFIQAAMGGLGGALSGGLNILDAAADLKILGGGRLLGGLGRGVRGLAGRGVGLAGRGVGLAGSGIAGGLSSIGMTGIGTGSAVAGLGAGAAIAGTAVGGFAAGDWTAQQLGIGLYGDAAMMGGDANAAFARADRETDRKRKLQATITALGFKADQEKTESLGGFTGLFRSQGVASEETTNAMKAAQEELKSIVDQEKEINTQLEKEEEKRKYLNGEIEKTKLLEVDIGLQLEKNDIAYSRQQKWLESSNKLLSSQIILLGKSGNIAGIGASVGENNQELDKQEAILKQRLALLQQEASSESDPVSQARIASQTRDVQAELNGLLEKRVENANSITFANKAQEEQLQRVISLTEANIALQDSAGMGLKAQVGARKELVDQLNVELSLLKQQESNALQQKAMAEQALSESKTQEEADRARRQMYEADKNILEIRQKQTATVQKQADVTKSMREGWISAINAMTTGAGVFTRIVIDQNSRLGNLAFSRPDKLKALRMGGTTGGRTDSAAWTPGGFKEGDAGAWEQDVLSNYGINPKSMVQDTVNAMMKYQEEKGSKMSPAAAAFGIGPQGTAEVTSAIAEGVKKAFDDKGSSTPKMIITEKDIDEIKRSFVDAFSKIGTEIVTETLKRIKDK